jgi:hypothetical protein
MVHAAKETGGFGSVEVGRGRVDMVGEAVRWEEDDLILNTFTLRYRN